LGVAVTTAAVVVDTTVVGEAVVDSTAEAAAMVVADTGKGPVNGRM
jgi:hypothetical protein